MKTFIIGFGYKAQRGKDTACRAIINAFSGLYSVKQYAFADALRDEVADAYEAFCEVHGYEKTPLAMQEFCAMCGVSYDPNALTSAQYPYGKHRELHQWWGMKQRAIDPDYWIKRQAERIERDQPEYALISDLRFKNEFAFCDYRVRLDRPGFEIETGADHCSEHELDVVRERDWDHVISASCTLELERAALGFFSTRFHPNWLVSGSRQA